MTAHSQEPRADDILVGDFVSVDLTGSGMTAGTAIYEEPNGKGAFQKSEVFFGRGQYLGERILKALSGKAGQFDLDHVPSGIILMLAAVGPAVDVTKIRPARKNAK